MSDPTEPLADDASMTLYQIGADGLLAQLTNNGQSVVVGTAVMDADRLWFRWLVEQACAANSLALNDQTSTGTRGKTYRANKAAITSVLVQAIAALDGVDPATLDATEPRAVALASLVMDVMSAPDAL